MYWILTQISMILHIQLLQLCKTSVMLYYFLYLTLSDTKIKRNYSDFTTLSRCSILDRSQLNISAVISKQCFISKCYSIKM